MEAGKPNCEIVSKEWSIEGKPNVILVKMNLVFVFCDITCDLQTSLRPFVIHSLGIYELGGVYGPCKCMLI